MKRIQQLCCGYICKALLMFGGRFARVTQVCTRQEAGCWGGPAPLSMLKGSPFSHCNSWLLRTATNYPFLYIMVCAHAEKWSLVPCTAPFTVTLRVQSMAQSRNRLPIVLATLVHATVGVVGLCLKRGVTQSARRSPAPKRLQLYYR
jgi:hypothetical protein